jgi:hypothetical protein
MIDNDELQWFATELQEVFSHSKGRLLLDKLGDIYDVPHDINTIQYSDKVLAFIEGRRTLVRDLERAYNYTPPVEKDNIAIEGI